MNWQKAIRLLMTVLTLALAAALCASTVALYAGGLARRQAANSLMEPIFTREETAAALRRIAPLGLAWLAVAAVAAVSGLLAPLRGRPAKARITAPAKMKGQPETKRRMALRAALTVLAALLLILGAFNGGLNDVLVKAVNICTECIGLG